ncbi:MAG: formylglycine-generating enzyme family protein [Bacteroidota bacterium]
MKNHTEILPDGTSFEMIFVEGGKQRLKGINIFEDEERFLEIEVSDFYMAKFPVTQALWEAIMGNNPSAFQGANRPVEKVSWEDAQVFLKKLNANLGLTEDSPNRYRLPSEVIWQYAAMGGQQSKGFQYAGSHILKEVAWYGKNSHDETKSVGLKLANELGLHNMSGNVWEWCEDRWHEDFENAPQDGSAWSEGESSTRVCRGGSWIYNFDYYCRVAYRNYYFSDFRDNVIGFRVTRY